MMKINRRKFLKVTGAGVAAIGAAALVSDSGWLFGRIYPGDAKKVFARCGTCSQTFFSLLNREFGHPEKIKELASDPLAGGLMNSQHQCGMLWGSALAAGAESFRRFGDRNQAVHQAMISAKHIMHSFSNRAKTLDCRDITFNFSNSLTMGKFMALNLPGGFTNMVCMNLAEKWAPEAINAAKEGLDEKELSPETLSCASEVAKKMGAGDEEIVTVSGLAGGIGLSGHACGALGAAIWISSREWCRKNPGKSGYQNPGSQKIFTAFKQITEGQFLCSEICGRKFSGVADHTEFVKNGGCHMLTDILAKA